MASSAMEISKRRQTVIEALQSYDGLKAEDILSHRSSSCTHHIIPASLGNEPMDNTAYAAFLGGVVPFLRNFHMNIKDIVEDEKENKVAVWANSTAESDIGPYANEYMFLFYLNKEGDKIEKILELMDASVASGFFKDLGEYIAKKQAEGK
ncbi:hypothetical protein F5884DRAFT_905891 [Xylogone sp. PMI_703]|nr:hypothetical protein F5884DRAFT_905891 [Xylogone sp. PMI_703]